MLARRGEPGAATLLRGFSLREGTLADLSASNSPNALPGE